MTQSMNKNVGIAVGVGIAVIIGAISYQIYDSTYARSTTEEYYENLGQVKNVVYPENPQKLRGLIINKDTYLLGENIFMRIVNIPMGLKDSVDFYTPGGIRYISVSFDGDEKSSMKHYFRPQLLLSLDLCDKDQLVGEWSVVFRGNPDERLKFRIIDEFLPLSEQHYESCGEAMQFAPGFSP